eukprot:TRINITY_DN7499_c0_g1_i1.p1 TRINITY_DN7499_c0_g1~~TRINITY_DN7499_c0_g1_i1.p1  ORF type:complete len:398 (-),score=154.43 TRINITY_DN7499_c0_g1_i1:24-1217(-)
MNPSKVICLIEQFLYEQGYSQTLESLKKESGITNEDENQKPSELLSILNEYIDFKAFLEQTNEDKDNKKEDQDLMTQGTGEYVKMIQNSFDNLHIASILSIKFHPQSGVSIMASGSGDKSVRVIDFISKETIWHCLDFKAGVLALDFNPVYCSLLLMGSMDSTVKIGCINQKRILQEFLHHKKYVVRAKWFHDGNGFVTGSYDKSICIYLKSDLNNNENPNFSFVKQIEFSGNVEAIEITKDNVLIVSIRGDNYLNYINLTGDQMFQIKRINMNLLGDDHVSFTVLDLALSPSGSQLAASTDRSRIILFRTGTPVQLRNYYGAENDSYGQPRLCWHSTGKYIYATSQDNKIYVWDAITEKIVNKLQAHTKLPRDLCFHNQLSLLASCSFDKTIRIWQ